MTRKRFIKLMMSQGMQRNDAVESARALWLYGSYDKMRLRSERIFSDARKEFSALSDTTDFFASFVKACRIYYMNKVEKGNDVARGT